VSNASFVAEKLGGKRKTRVKFIANCPAHDDQEMSLIIWQTKNNPLGVVCTAGCGERALVAALKSQGAWPFRS
jgi:hypothetical protein